MLVVRIATMMLGVALAGSALAQSTECAPLISRLDALEVPRGAGLEDAIAAQRYEIDRALEDADAVGCGAGSPTAQCRSLNVSIRRMERNLDRLERQARRGGGVDIGEERQRVIARLAALNCAGFTTRSRERPLTAGTFEGVFGDGPLDPLYALPPSALAPAAPVAVMTATEAGQAPDDEGGFRTICVRACDGAFFPISFSTSRTRFETDAAVCAKMCPAAEAELFAYRTHSERPEDAFSTRSGDPLTLMPNAFRFRRSFDPACSCRKPGQSWSEALAPLERQLEAQPDEQAAAVKPSGRADGGATMRGAIRPPDGQRSVRQVGPLFDPQAN